MARKKKSNVGTYAAIAGGSAALAGGYYVFRRLTNDEDAPEANAAIVSPSEPSSSGKSSSGGTTPHAPLAPELAFPLRIGDRNEYVRNLQAALIKGGGEPARILRERGGADGIFGDATKDALYASGHVNRWYIIMVTGVLEISRSLYEKIVNKSTLSGVPMATAYAARDTFLLTPETVADDKAYPVRAGVRLGKLKGMKDGIAEIVHGNGQSYFTKEADVELR